MSTTHTTTHRYGTPITFIQSHGIVEYRNGHHQRVSRRVPGWITDIRFGTPNSAQVAEGSCHYSLSGTGVATVPESEWTYEMLNTAAETAKSVAIEKTRKACWPGGPDGASEMFLSDAAEAAADARHWTQEAFRVRREARRFG
jgi:hypothetical protein